MTAAWPLQVLGPRTKQMLTAGLADDNTAGRGLKARKPYEVRPVGRPLKRRRTGSASKSRGPSPSGT